MTLPTIFIQRRLDSGSRFCLHGRWWRRAAALAAQVIDRVRGSREPIILVAVPCFAIFLRRGIVHVKQVTTSPLRHPFAN